MLKKKLKITMVLFVGITSHYVNSMQDIDKFLYPECSNAESSYDLKSNVTNNLDILHQVLMLQIVENCYMNVKQVVEEAKQKLNPFQFKDWINKSNDRLGYSALTLAVQNDFTDIIMLLIRFEADPYLRDYNGMNAIAVARSKSLSQEKILLNIFKPTTKPVPMCVYHRRIIEILLEEHEADVDCRFVK